MDAPTYATTDDLSAASDIIPSTAAERGLLGYLDVASRDVETLCGGRRFYATTETRTLDWPDPSGASRSETLWLDSNELAGEPTQILVAGAAFTAYKLRPQPPDGPPYRWIEPNYGTTGLFGGFSAGQTGPQDAVSITGPFGYCQDLDEVTTLTAAVSSTTATTITVADGSRIGPGDAIKLDSEYLLIEASAFTATSDTLAADLALDATDDEIPVTDGTAYTAGETIQIDRERMTIEEIIGNSLYVARGDRSRLATHTTGAAVRARRQFTVTRGALGTDAATHLTATAVYRSTPPSYVRLYTIALAMTSLANERAAWARTMGQGENEREMTTRNLNKLEATVRRKYGMRGHHRGIGGTMTP